VKKGIHPKYYPEAKVTCACGNTWTTGSTIPEIRADICSACHPFFTGEQRIVDTGGQVERFRRRLAQAATLQQPPVEKPAKKAASPTPGKRIKAKAQEKPAESES